MASSKVKEPKKDTQARIDRTEAYAEKVRLMFAQTVNEILAFNKTAPDIDGGEMYSFDGDSRKVQREVERLLRQLHSVCTTAIKNGISLEWAQANAECDKLVSSAFGKKALDGSGTYSGYVNRNNAAMRAFADRADGGLNLSERVWQSVRQLKDEMEVALTVSMGEGSSAQEISRGVRKYLNDPDLMFRRFRYKDDSGEWRRKWKKRIKDETTGKYKWIDYDKRDYKTGAGVYKSSAKNAMRVARTETNMAYRNADSKRWQQMDFVLGIHIEPSSHTKKERKKDICDKLAGDYPKDFVFEGWHPQCFCVATPILVPEEEMIAKAEAEDRGEEYHFKAKPIKGYPEGFRQWVGDNADRIKESRLNGNEPYFLAHNRKAIDGILNPKTVLTPQERAEIRHAQRTPEKERMLREYWAKKRAEGEERRKYETSLKGRAGNVLDIAAKNGYVSMGADTTALEAALKSGDIAFIGEQTKQLVSQMQAIKKPILKGARETIDIASDFGEVDATALKTALSARQLLSIKQETKALKSVIAATMSQEEALEDLIPNVHDWHKQFTMAQLQGAYDAVKSKLDSISTLPLDKQLKAVTKELNWVADPNYITPHKQHATWKVAQDAYTKKAGAIQEAIQWEDIKTAYNAELSFKSKSVPYNTLVSKLDKAIQDGNLSEAQSLKTQIAVKRAELAKAAATRDAKKGKLVFPELDEETAETLYDEFELSDISDVDALNSVYRKITEGQWPNLTTEERFVATKYTQTYSYLNEPLRNQTYLGGQKGGDEDTKKLTSCLNKCKVPKTFVVRRGTNDYNIHEIGKMLSEVKAGDVFIDGAFLSTACHREKGFFYEFNLVIVVPKGARGIFAEPFSHYNHHYPSYSYATNDIWDGVDDYGIGSEFEFIAQRGNKFKVMSVIGKTIYLQIIGQLFSQPSSLVTP